MNDCVIVIQIQWEIYSAVIFFCRNDRYEILHMARQLYWRGMRKILLWYDIL